MDLEKILIAAVTGGASDIILKNGSLPKFRFNGRLVEPAGASVISASIMQDWMEIMVPPHLRERLRELADLDFAYENRSGSRFRVNLFRQRQNFGVVLRIVNNHIRTIEELQLPLPVAQLSKERRGLILVTGSTGSGKSTTLAAIIEKINHSKSYHIVTIEDPIEFLFKDKKSTINQREIGIDTSSFPAALRSALRQNPDVILVGELRDRETTETALNAAETGHLVLSTLHTKDSVESLTRLLAYFEPHQHDLIRTQLTQTLLGIVSQRLLPRIDGKGMVPAVEILIANELVKDVVQNNKNLKLLHDAIKSGKDNYGMQSFDQSLLSLLQRGVISREEALSQATSPKDFELALRGVA